MAVSRRDTQPLKLTILVGLALTLLVVVLEKVGLLEVIERRLYDRRARDCQYFMPRPTDALVHIDIDDESLESIGRWPWPRQRLAQVIDEINLAGVKVVALDIVLAEPQSPEIVRRDERTFDAIDHDDELAQALRRGGNVIVPIAMGIPAAQRTAVEQQLGEMFAANLALTYDQAQAALGTQAPLDAAMFRNEQRAAMSRALTPLLHADPSLSDLSLRRTLLSEADSQTVTAAQRMLLEQRLRTQAFLSLRRFAQPAPSSVGPLPALGRSPPIPPLAAEVCSTGVVDFVEDDDGVARQVPLAVEHEGQLYPQVGLALALAYLDVPFDSVRIDPHQLVIPMSDGSTRRIPLTRRDVPGLGTFDLFAPLAWFGKTDDWRLMYDWPEHRRSAQHLPMAFLWDVMLLRQRLADNSAQADDAIRAVLLLSSPTLLEEFGVEKLDADAVESRLRWIDRAVNEGQFMADILRQMKPQDVLAEAAAAGEAERQRLESLLDPAAVDAAVKSAAEAHRHQLEVFLPSLALLGEVRAQLPRLQEQIVRRRGELRELLQGKAAIIGLTAMATGDYVPTSLHTRCPGVVCHGLVFNSVLTSEAWRVAPHYVTLLITLAMGLIATLLTALVSPVRSLLVTVALVVGYWFLNGVALFDYGNVVVGVASPMLAAVLIWTGGTLAHFVVERAERQRVRDRFASYVDPVLVDYVLEQRDRARFDGERRELTVVFTDLAGFTTISERLQEATVPLLNDYMERMVPIIRRHRGYVNKFLGDGIMFFHGAPRQSPRHAFEAVDVVLEMQRVMVPFNEELAKRGLPAVAVRCGVNSGFMIVGDAGPHDASDYTVLGDAVNLAARLESANKAVGTRIMIGQRTAELLEGKYLLRTIGRLQVVGKTQGVMTYEPLCLVEDGHAQRRLIAELSAAIADHFIAGRFRPCLQVIEQFESEVGEHKLAKLYKSLCAQHLVEPPGEEFTGTLVLESK